jgi:hypothetical protein
MAVWYAGWNEIPPCILDRYPHRITSSRYLKNTTLSPDGGPIVAKNM